MSTPVKDIPGAIFWPYYSQFPHTNDGVFANQVANWRVINEQLLSNFNLHCIEWKDKAIRDRANGLSWDPKPIAPNKTVVLKEGNDPLNPTDFASGMWIAVIQDGPVGICPDLPPVYVQPIGKIADDKNRTPPNDQLFASLEIGLAEIKKVVDLIKLKIDKL